MKSKVLTVIMTVFSTLTSALTLMSPSLAHANEQIVCKLQGNPAYGIAVTYIGPKIPTPTGISKKIDFDPHNPSKSAVAVTFFGPNYSNSVHAVLTSFHSETRVGPETSYLIELGQNEKINLDEKYWSYEVNSPNGKSFTGTYETSGKFYQLACK
jgi:hypothetical protein